MKISDEVRDVLLRAEWVGDGFELRLPGQLDRKLYLKVDDALRALGGKWNRHRKAHVFDCHDATRLRALIRNDLAPGALEAVKTDKELGYFATPRPLARKMALSVVPHVRSHPWSALEPSAGEGAIASELRRAGAFLVQVVEIDDGRRSKLREAGFDVIGSDFFALEHGAFYFDAIVMNPPFSRQHGHDALAHLRHAWKFLAPNGRIVCVLPGSASSHLDYAGRETSKIAFADWLRDAKPQPAIWDLPPRSFAESGTDVSACVLEATKRGDTESP